MAGGTISGNIVETNDAVVNVNNSGATFEKYDGIDNSNVNVAISGT